MALVFGVGCFVDLYVFVLVYVLSRFLIVKQGFRFVPVCFLLFLTLAVVSCYLHLRLVRCAIDHIEYVSC